ncbi:MAG: hypothetical protein WEA82_06360 [Idiomarina sp.]
MSIESKGKSSPIDWKQEVQAWRTSGLPMNRFCQQRGLVTHQLGYYKRKYEAASAPIETGRSPFAQVSIAASEPGSGLVIRLANGLVIEGISAQNIGVADALVRALS